MSDGASYGAPQHDSDGLRHTMSLKEVEAALLAAAVPRSHRHIVRLCQSGAFDAAKRPGGSGDEWFIAPQSVPKVIGDLRSIEEARARHSSPQHAMSDRVAAEIPNNRASDTARHDAPERATSGSNNEQEESPTESAAPLYVGQLETRIKEKDEVIGMLRGELVNRNEEIVRRNERERETNILIRGLQNLVLRLQPGKASSADVLDGDTALQNREPNTAGPA